MESVDSVLFIGTALIALTEVVRRLVPAVSGVVTIGVAAVLGAVVALVDTHIGVADITVAQGLMTGLSAAGVVAVAKHAGDAPAKDVR